MIGLTMRFLMCATLLAAAAVAAASNDAPAAKAGEAPRTLEAIQIKGEIAVPQVLFITARDQRRVLDFQHHRYLRTSRALGAATPTPVRIVVMDVPSHDTHKENRP